MDIVAHRGNTEFFPENTMISFEAAYKAGADVIELDVHMTSDSYLVVHHDYYLGRTNDGQGKVYEKDLSYIQSLDAGSWFDPKFHDQKIPLLAEVFTSFQKKIRFELELKGFGFDFIQNVADLVKQYDLWDYIEFTSTPNYLISSFKREFPKARVGIFIPSPSDWMDIDLAQKMAIDNLILGKIDVGHFPLSLVSSNFVDMLRRSQIRIHTANCDTITSILESLNLKVDQISTNKLNLAIELTR